MIYCLCPVLLSSSNTKANSIFSSFNSIVAAKIQKVQIRLSVFPENYIEIVATNKEPTSL